LLQHRIHPAIARRHAPVRPSPDRYDGVDRRGVAAPGPPPAAGKRWGATPPRPETGGHAWPPIGVASRWCVAPDAARSAARADGRADRSGRAAGGHLEAPPRSAPRAAPHPPGAPPATLSGDDGCADGETHRNRGGHGDEGATQLRGRTRHRLGETTGLWRHVLVQAAALRAADRAPGWLAAADTVCERWQHLWADLASRGQPLRTWRAAEAVDAPSARPPGPVWRAEPAASGAQRARTSFLNSLYK
jgi:hypothetical protein